MGFARFASLLKKLVPATQKHRIFAILSFLTQLTIRDRALKLFAKSQGARLCRVLSGKMRGAVFVNPVGQRSPAYVLGTFEPWIEAVMRTHVRAGDTVFDVGANVGWHSIGLSRLVGRTGLVFAFEPSPNDRTILETNVSANRIDNVTVMPLALAESVGRLSFACFTSPGVHHIVREDTPTDATIIVVDGESIDHLVYDVGLPKPSFLKVDVEGGELAVLRGARRLMADSRPTLVVELHRGKPWEDLLAVVTPLGYRMTELHGDDYLADVLLEPVDATTSAP
jgi:FkbM family methyltransferase